jgi:hypothetical protein
MEKDLNYSSADFFYFINKQFIIRLKKYSYPKILKNHKNIEISIFSKGCGIFDNYISITNINPIHPELT